VVYFFEPVSHAASLAMAQVDLEASVLHATHTGNARLLELLLDLGVNANAVGLQFTFATSLVFLLCASIASRRPALRATSQRFRCAPQGERDRGVRGLT
jgi:hypothetical protein